METSVSVVEEIRLRRVVKRAFSMSANGRYLLASSAGDCVVALVISTSSDAEDGPDDGSG